MVCYDSVAYPVIIPHYCRLKQSLCVASSLGVSDLAACLDVDALARVAPHVPLEKFADWTYEDHSAEMAFLRRRFNELKQLYAIRSWFRR
jgi:hypothetical protein